MKQSHLFTTIALTLVVSGCGGGSSSGLSFFDDCSSYRGSWAGPATAVGPRDAGTMNISITQEKDSCEVKGAVAFPPCVPVTPIEGTLDKGFLIGTVDGSLNFGGLEKHATVGDPRPIGSRTKQDWVFTNVNNVPGCPASDSGFVELTKVSD